MSDEKTSSTRLTKDQELAILGHCLVDKSFARQCFDLANGITSGFLFDPMIESLYLELQGFVSEKNRLPLEKEFEAKINDRHGDLQSFSKYCALASKARLARETFGKDILLDSLKHWLETVVLRHTINEAAKAFNVDKFEKCSELVAEYADRIRAVNRKQIPSIEAERQALAAEGKRHSHALRNAHSFLSKKFDDIFKLTPGLTAIGGNTKSGKSTCSGNMVLDFINNSSGRLLYLTNEETRYKVLGRIACLHHGVDPGRFITDRLDVKEQPLKSQVEGTMAELTSRITVVSNGPECNTCDLDDVKKVLEFAKDNQEFTFIIVDFYQNVNVSSKFKGDNAEMRTLKAFGAFLKDFCADIRCPVVTFLQLRPENNRAIEEFSDRVRADRQICMHCHNVLEIRANKEEKTTAFKVIYNRDGNSEGKEMYCRWNRGRLTPVELGSNNPPLDRAHMMGKPGNA